MDFLLCWVLQPQPLKKVTWNTFNARISDQKTGVRLKIRQWDSNDSLFFGGNESKNSWALFGDRTSCNFDLEFLSLRSNYTSNPSKSNHLGHAQLAVSPWITTGLPENLEKPGTPSELEVIHVGSFFFGIWSAGLFGETLGLVPLCLVARTGSILEMSIRRASEATFSVTASRLADQCFFFDQVVFCHTNLQANSNIP